MITRRSLFLGTAAVITTPGLLMPVRKIITPPWIGVDRGDIRGDCTVVACGLYRVEIGRIERFNFITSPRLA